MTLELCATGMATGGEAVARDGSGRVVFVTGAIPGERVLARIVDEKRDFARAVVERVLLASPDRTEPPCPHVAEGCGGCGWQHIAPEAQAPLKRGIVVDALRRIGRVPEPDGLVVNGPELAPLGARTTVRAGVVDGRVAFRRRRSHDLLAVDDCLIAHPLISELVVEGHFGAATEVTLRAGARTGERLVLARPTAAGVRVPEGVLVVGADELTAGRRAWHHEMIAGRSWRISAHSFFQARADGADALVDLVTSATRELAPDAGTLVDLYSGVGLFAGTAGAGHRVVAVEQNRDATADATHNLAGLDVRVVRASIHRWRPSAADVVVADPARSGLGTDGVNAVAATGATGVVLVSCDPASLGRDTALLANAGYEFVGATVVDLFPHTPHVEVVSRYRAGRGGPRAVFRDKRRTRSARSNPRRRPGPKSG